jgi:serine/threonine-protein kinase
MGIVFIGYQKSLKRQVAVKMLPKARVTDEFFSRQFREEAEIIAILSHPNIIPIFEMGEREEFYFQVMQLVSGADLATVVRNRLKHPVASKRLLPLERSLSLVIDVLDGLGYAHEEGVVHQDIKPANILVEERRARPLIADFGIAKAAQAEYTSQGLVVGSPTYFSPEQAAGRETDRRTDIYAVGVMLFEMLSGDLPIHHEGVREKIIRKIRTPHTFFTAPPSAYSPLIDARLEEIILTALSPDPERRYQDCESFRLTLEEYRRRAPR